MRGEACDASWAFNLGFIDRLRAGYGGVSAGIEWDWWNCQAVGKNGDMATSEEGRGVRWLSFGFGSDASHGQLALVVGLSNIQQRISHNIFPRFVRVPVIRVTTYLATLIASPHRELHGSLHTWEQHEGIEAMTSSHYAIIIHRAHTHTVVGLLVNQIAPRD